MPSCELSRVTRQSNVQATVLFGARPNTHICGRIRWKERSGAPSATNVEEGSDAGQNAVFAEILQRLGSVERLGPSAVDPAVCHRPDLVTEYRDVDHHEPGPRMSDHYVSVPPSGSGHGVLVLHAWWGLNAFVRRLCDRLARAGYTALAPDLYGGAVAETAAAAKVLRTEAMSGRREPAYRFLMRKLEALTNSEAVLGGDVGVLGLSMGGHWALWLAQRPELPIAATVTFYACRNGDYSRTKSSFLCHFAESDPWVSDRAKRRLLRSFERDEVDARSFEYPGTHHWFFESDRKDVFHRRAARLAWTRTLRFLDGRLNE